MAQRAWHDEEDDVKKTRREIPQSSMPSWAEEALESKLRKKESKNRKRSREERDGAAYDAAEEENEDMMDDDKPSVVDKTNATLQHILSRAEPVGVSKHLKRQQLAPKPLHTVFTPQEEVKDMAWHPHGDALITMSKSTVYVHHVNGKFVEKVSSTKIRGRMLTQLAVVPTGEQAIVLQERNFIPQLMTLTTGQITPLNFLDTRVSAPHILGANGKKVDQFPTLLAMKPNDGEQGAFAMCVGSSLVFGSLAQGTVAQRTSLPADVTDCCYLSEHMLACSFGQRVALIDMRKTARHLCQFQDEGALEISRIAAVGSNSLVVGSSSGHVNLYADIGFLASGNTDASNGSSSSIRRGVLTPKPTKTWQNLSTPVDMLMAGKIDPTGHRRADNATDAFVMGSSSQAAGFRFVSLPNGVVAPSFPSQGMNHTFPTCMAFNPKMPVFTVGEYGRIVSYRC